MVDEWGGGAAADDGAESPHATVHAAGAVPAGFWIFGETNAAPEGWAATGARLTLPQAAPAWQPAAPLPDAGPGQVRCVVVNEAVFAFRDGTRDVLRYDPLAGHWRVEAHLPEAWTAFAAAALDGRIHLVGGRDGRGRMVRWHRAWDPATGRWETCAPLDSGRCEMGAASLHGVLYVTGGVRALLSRTTDAVDAYDPRANAWTGCRRMGHARARPAVAASAGRLFVVGGRQPGLGAGRASPAAESYDPARGQWKELDDVPTPRRDAALAELDGTLYLVGGDVGTGATGLTHAWVPREGWTKGPELREPRSRLGLAAVSGRLLAVGGATGDGAAGTVEECRLFFDLHGFRKE